MPVRPGHDPLVDRDVELCRLDEHVRALADRRESAAVTLAGPSGTGLTTLLEHVVRRARERELTVALARCSPAEVELPYGVVSQLGAELSHAAYRPSLRALSRTGQETAAVAELCAEFLALARHGPVLLAVDDAHWADPLSRRWLRAFAARLRQAPVLLVRTLVPGASTPDHHPPGIEHPVTVRPLGEEAVDELIGSRLGERADRSFLAGATELTGGRVAVLRPSLDRYARDSLTPVAERLPVLAGYVAEVLGERAARIVDRLPPEALAVVRAIAVAGDDLEPTFVHALASPRTPPATAVLDGLAALGLVTRTERPRLTAPTVRARVLAGMGTGERERMAGRAAELARRMALPDERIACLLPAAPPGTVGWGVPLLRRVAERARAAGEPDDAAALLNRALRERPGPELRHELLTDLALTERPGDPDAAARRLRQVLLEAGPEIPLRGLVRAADLLQALGEAPVARHAIAAACARRAPGAAGPLAAIGLLAAGDGIADPVLPECPLPGLPDLPADPVQAGVLAWRLTMRGGWRSRARELASTALRSAGGDRPFGPRIHACRALLYAEEPEEAVLGLDQVLRDARRQGAPMPAVLALLELARCELARGNLAPAAEDLAAARAQLPPESWPPRVVPDLLALEAGLHFARDEPEEAERVLAVPLPAAAAEGMAWAHLQYARGRLRMLLADPGAALPRFLECGRTLMLRRCLNPAVSAWRSMAAAAHAAGGDHAAAEPLTRAAVRLARRWGGPDTLGAVHLLAASSRCGDPVDHLRAAVPLLRRSPARRSRALAESAMSRIAAGDRDGVQRLLDAPAAAGGPGAVPWHGSLSAQERRIATLAAAGWSTTRIAGLLTLGGRTVEQRLTRVYRKLGLSGRAQLVSIFHPATMAG